MLLLTFLILPVISSVLHHRIPGIAFDIYNKKLDGIRFVGDPPDQVDLSYFDLRAVDENAFMNLPNLKRLVLSYNKLRKLPALSYLSKLEGLILNNNVLKSGQFYVGLSNLKWLNIANNQLRSLEPGHFFGLPKSVEIYTAKLNLLSISTAIFENPANLSKRRPFAIEQEKYKIDEDNDAKWSDPRNSFFITVCIQNGLLMAVETLENSSFLSEGCGKISLSSAKLSLNRKGIILFANGWYQLQDQSVISIDLSNNQIAVFSEKLLNDLPAGIRKVNLSGNKIKTLEKGIIERRNSLDVLDLSDNFISYIEYGALEKLNLTGSLYLDDNYLTSTQFLDSLPPFIQHVSMDHNNIVKLSVGYFIKFTQFENLSLVGNEIKEIMGRTLHNFLSLTHLALRMNDLQTFDPMIARDLNNLLHLDLSDNKISRIEDNTFSGFGKMKFISLYNNKIEDHLTRLLEKMPNALEDLRLGRNFIMGAAATTHSPEPTTKLGSGSCQFPTLPCSTYNLSNLKVLDLHNNLLMEIDNDSFHGAENLAVLSLAANKIETIKKGLTRNLGNLYVLDLSDNPIGKLTNGSLFGLPKDSETFVYVNRLPLHDLQGGVFDNV